MDSQLPQEYSYQPAAKGFDSDQSAPSYWHCKHQAKPDTETTKHPNHRNNTTAYGSILWSYWTQGGRVGCFNAPNFSGFRSSS